MYYYYPELSIDLSPLRPLKLLSDKQFSIDSTIFGICQLYTTSNHTWYLQSFSISIWLKPESVEIGLAFECFKPYIKGGLNIVNMLRKESWRECKRLLTVDDMSNVYISMMADV